MGRNRRPAVSPQPPPTAVRAAGGKSDDRLGRALGLLALGGFAVAQPLYSLLRSYPEFLVAHRTSPGDLLLLTVVLSLLMPALPALPGLLLRRGRLGWAADITAATGLSALWWAQLLALGPSFDGPPALAVILLLGAAGGWLYARQRAWRRVLAALALAALVLPLAFLLRPPIRDLLRDAPPQDGSILPLVVDTPVLLLVLDELPLTSLLDGADSIDRSRFPHFARLADDGVWYRNATTVAESTSYAVPAILTGRYPFADRLMPTARHYPTNLFTLLGRRQTLHVVETITSLCPGELCAERPGARLPTGGAGDLAADLLAIYLNRVVPTGLGLELPELGDRWTGFWDREDAQEPPAVGEPESRRQRRARRKRPRPTFERFIAEIDNYPAATLHYLHVLLPHAPWRYVPSGQSYPALPNTGALRDPETGDFSWVGDEWEIAQGLQRHLLQVGFVDRLLGALWERLEALDLYQRALIVVVADHGAAFRRGHSTRHPGPGTESLIEIANVPLIVKYPDNSRRGIDDGNVETIDILPTVIAELGGDLDTLRAGGADLDGVPLQHPARRVGKRLYPSWGPGSARGNARDFSLARLAGRSEVVATLHAPISGVGWPPVYAMGPLGGLVGREASEIDHRGELDSVFDGAQRFARVDPAARSLPLLISGRLLQPDTRGQWLALLVNDRVAAVTRTVSDGAFRAMIAPGALAPGRNRLRVVGVEAPAAGARGEP